MSNFVAIDVRDELMTSFQASQERMPIQEKLHGRPKWNRANRDMIEGMRGHGTKQRSLRVASMSLQLAAQDAQGQKVLNLEAVARQKTARIGEIHRFDDEYFAIAKTKTSHPLEMEAHGMNWMQLVDEQRGI